MGKPRSTSTRPGAGANAVDDPIGASEAFVGTVGALLTSAQVARYLRVSEATLSRWRQQSIGPNWIDLAGIARYRPEDLEAHLKAMRR